MPLFTDSTELRILIVGGDSPLAHAIGDTLQYSKSMVESLVNGRVKVYAPPAESMDITWTDKVISIVGEYRPHLIINTAQIGTLQSCEADPMYAREVNSEGPFSLALAANAYDAWLVHFSTAYVFHGSNGPYKDTDPVFPVQFYGTSKALGESVVRQIAPDRSTVIRLGWLYGPRYRSRGGDVVELGATSAPADRLGAISYLPHVSGRLVGHFGTGFTPGVFNLAPLSVNNASWYDVLLPHYPKLKPIRDTGRSSIHDGVIPRSVGMIPSPGWEIPDPDMGIEDYRFHLATGERTSSWSVFTSIG